MITALVTGADGFIGSHLVELLLSKNFNVRAFCLYNSLGTKGWLDTLPKEKLDNIEIIFGDIRDPDSVYEAVKGVNIIFHLASLISIPYSYKVPSSYIDTNVKGTLNVLNATKNLEIDHLVHTSTSETYGSAKYVPIKESHPLVGQSPYAASKIAADQLALSFWRSFSTPVSILRPFNTYGPRQSTRAVIPTIISQISNGNKYLKLGNLDPTRDFNFVNDTCEAFYAVSQAENIFGEVINAASNFEISIRETAKLISELMNKDIKIKEDSTKVRPKLSELSRLFGCNEKLKEKTLWQPNYSGIDGFKKGLKETINWFSKKENLQYYKFTKNFL